MMLVNAIELARKVKRWWGQCLMAIELCVSFLTLSGSVLVIIALPFADVSVSQFFSVIGLAAIGILQWRWRAAIWPSIRKHQRTLLEQTDLSA